MTWTGKTFAVLETGGNQAYIGETNRLRAAVGASQRIVEIIDFAKDQAAELAIGNGAILATSGKAEALFDTPESAREWIRRVTRKALVEIPGLDIVGAMAPGGEDPGATVEAAYRELARARGSLPGPRFRYQKLPWMAEADVSGEPAIPERWEADSEVTMSPSLWSRLNRVRSESKSEAPFEAFRERTVERLRSVGEPLPDRLLDQFAWNIDHLDSAQDRSDGPWSYIAVVHADGNGLGKIFMNLGKLCAAVPSLGPYESRLQKFSAAIDAAAWRSFARALKAVWDAWTKAGEREIRRETTPVLPLVVGGDDLTALCAGQFALLLASEYLKAFESISEEDANIRAVVSEARARNLGPAAADRFDGVRACAGVAIVKHHFPFSLAYQLAENLIQSAKKATTAVPCSALDWHAVLDASPPDFGTLRERLKVVDVGRGNGIELTRRPYRVGKSGPTGIEHFDSVVTAVKLLKEKQDGRRVLPASQMHDLRAALFGGRSAVDTRLRQLASGGKPELVQELAEKCSGDSKSSLIGQDGRTAFLDALDHQEFFGGLA